MNFRRHRHREEPEINFIPLIDLLLVILIFLMVTTTYSRFAELEINLPQANGQAEAQKTARIQVVVSASGAFRVDNQSLATPDLATLAQALKQHAADKKEPVVVINADAKASHQSVVTVMEAAREAGLVQLTFATRQEGK